VLGSLVLVLLLLPGTGAGASLFFSFQENKNSFLVELRYYMYVTNVM